MATATLPGFTPLPARDRLTGPRTRRATRRTGAILGTAWSAGIILAVVNASAGLTAFGLGLLLPGGGFAYSGDPLLVAAAVVAFVAGFAIFFLFSPLWLPVVVWVGSAGFAAHHAAGSSVADGARLGVPLALAAILVSALVAHRVARTRTRARVRAANAHLAGRTWSPPLRTDEPPVGAPLDDRQLASLRYALDLALQPLDRFDGFATLDQFREAAWRYQLNGIGWGLAMAQYTRIPAFAGYVGEAQRNAIEKMADPGVWKYWRWENLLGNLRWAPDPMAFDNVMLTGYYATQLAAYETVSGDRRYDAPGCLAFDDGRHRYEYSFPAVAEALRRNYARGPGVMYSCEPNWVFPRCNQIGMVGLGAFDRLHDTSFAAPLREPFDSEVTHEYATPDDRVITMCSNRVGVSVPGFTKSMVTDADQAFWLSPLLPEVAARRWELVRHNHLSVDGDGILVVPRAPFNLVDAGNYKLNTTVLAIATVMLGAAEMGDDEMYAAAELALDREHDPRIEDGVLRLDASPYATLIAGLASVTRRHGWHDLMTVGAPADWPRRPRLAEAPYPDALVALAVSDGRDLELELAPGSGGGRVALSLDRLRPDHTYSVRGATVDRVTADARGAARVEVDLDARQRVSITPPA